jgi:hypothetical protein
MNLTALNYMKYAVAKGVEWRNNTKIEEQQ